MKFLPAYISSHILREYKYLTGVQIWILSASDRAQEQKTKLALVP